MSPATPFRPLFRSDTYRTLLFLAAAVPVGAAALGVFVAGWTTTAVLAVTPLVVPALIGFRAAVGLLARADAELARALLAVEASPRIRSGGRGFWGRAKAVLADAAFWRQQAYLAVRTTAGFAFAVGEISLLAASLGSAVFPAWYRWSDLHLGSWHVDTLGRSFVLVPAGIAGLVVAGQLARVLGGASAWLVRMLLRGEPDHLAPPTRAARRRALGLHAGVAAGLGVLSVVLWAVTSRGYFWPEWVLLPLALPLAIHGLVELVEGQPRLRRRRGLAIHAGVLASVVAFLVLVWAVTTRGYFWPLWPLLGALVLLGAHAALASRSRLARRVDDLEASRSGALDAQGAQLRRIERDLHDGAQARLVALGMNLGLAEQKLASDPEAAQQLVTETRLGIAEALRELRDLARGIHPPVLSDRGLEAALATLADRSALPVSLSVDLDGRPAPAVETAAYFVVAEALANAAKHSGASRVDVRVRRSGPTLELEIVDDGGGGADPAGSGLTGLRHRVEALDGTLAVVSPPGGTTVRAELPCGS